MSSILQNAAVAAVTRCQPSKFYDRENRPNPVLQKLDQELKLFVGYIKKRGSPGYTKPAEESPSRASDTLFELWNKYQLRLPVLYYQKKLLETGDFLVSAKEYRLACWQCYDRCLQTFGNINVEDISDVETFHEVFFPDGFQAETAPFLFRALIGRSVCLYRTVEMSDPKLQNKQSVERCVQILNFIRFVTQMMLPKESLCWLVYNGTIHIYSICRHLMSLGHSVRVLEYLLWASMCMETSVPLLTAKYLSWRGTLYTAVCQCYYDCKAGEHAENFARRGLAKIHDLSQLEMMSSGKDMAVHSDNFRSATVRMAVMVFRRTVIESRRKPKGLLRPKTRANLKELLNLPWPRTTTEKMLAEMFEGSSAQFLAILESLNSSHRRILQTSPPASDNEPEILDVYCELMMAAQEILAGGGGSKSQGQKSQMSTGTSPLFSVTIKGSLMDMATKGEEGVPLDSVIRLVKLAYCYEQWDVFEALLNPVLTLVKESKDERFCWDEKALELLSAMGKVNANRRGKKQTPVSEEEQKPAPLVNIPPGKKGKVKLVKTPEVIVEKPAESVKYNLGDDLISIADVLQSIVLGPYKQSEAEVDLVVDAVLYLWSKCKQVFQKFQTGSVDNVRFLQKMENPQMEVDFEEIILASSETQNQDEPIEFSIGQPETAWIYILETIHEALVWCGIYSVDAAVAAEVVLRLAMIYESSAKLGTVGAIRSAQTDRNVPVMVEPRENTHSTILPNQTPLATPASARAQLLQAKEILQRGLKNVNVARRSVALIDGMDIAEVTWIKEFNPDIFGADLREWTIEDKINMDEPVNPDFTQADSLSGMTAVIWNTIRDLHLELILMYHRVCLKLSALGPDTSTGSSRRKIRQTTGDKRDVPSAKTVDSCAVEDFNEMCSKCRRNSLSKALLYAQRAMMLGTEMGPTQEQKKLLEDAVSLIQRTQAEEKIIYCDNTGRGDQQVRGKVPAPPILLCRTDTYMVFKPAPFEPESGEKVAWYRIFARCASGPNVKARLSDNHFPGTGEQVPSLNCELKVTDLEPDERYVFAVAAYTADGKLIGDQIGKTTKPILASHLLSVLATYGFVSQMAYQVRYYSVAKQAFNFLWEYFVMKPQSTCGTTCITQANKDFKITLQRLNLRAVRQSSLVLLRQFLTSIFISTDTAVKEGQLFCDIVCAKDIFYEQQTQRLKQCEFMLVAIEMAGWLNEANLALQAVVQIYGLLASILYHKIPSISVMQILQRIHSVLQVIPPDLVQKRQGSVSESLNHMIACITYNLAKTLRASGQKEMASIVINSGRSLLMPDADTKLPEEKSDNVTEIVGKGPKQVNFPPKMKPSKDNADGPPVNEELRALEALELIADQSASLESEVTGNEDPNILHAYISCLPSFVAFKEVDKFKSKPRYLEFLVHVSRKGLAEGLTEQVVRWCDDGAKWLAVRNDAIIGRQGISNSKQRGAGVVNGDDPKNYSAAMTQYRRETKALKPTLSKTGASRKAKYKPLRVTASMSDTSQQLQKEAELKALDILEQNLLELYRSKKRYERMRKIVLAEMPWRSQMNIIQGLCHFSMFLQKLEKKEKLSGQTMNRSNVLDPEWFTLETSGVVIIGWEGGLIKRIPVPEALSSDQSDSQPKQASGEVVDKEELTAIEVAAAALTVSPQPANEQSAEQEETPRTNKVQVASLKNSIKPQADAYTHPPDSMTDFLVAAFICLRKAIILAHRGHNWTLLQNACHTLWNCGSTLLLHACSTGETGLELLTTDNLQSVLWYPFYVASDCLLDMMAVLQDTVEKQDKNRSNVKDNYFESWMGNVESEKGGSSLKFDPLLDDTSIVDVHCVRRIVLRTLEMLYLEEKCEKLVDIALRFNALTDNRYTEQVIPLMVQAQRFLEKRIAKAGGPAPPQVYFKVLEAGLGHVVQAKDYLKAQLTVAVNISKFIDLELEAQVDSVSRGPYSRDDAIRLSAVPLDTMVSLTALSDAIDHSHYTARALQHSRKLLCLYLAGQHNFKESLQEQEISHVDFKTATGQPHLIMPPGKISSDFSHANEVEFSPIPQSQLGTVISSYEKTIDMLCAKNQKGLSAQAMHELGNIFFHIRNTKAAFKWWNQALNLVLNTSDALHTWHNFPNSGDISVAFLDKCGLWGCLLAGVLASNIAQYTLPGDSELRTECCLLSGYLFKGLFRSSLPHPTADRDYAVYDVGEGHNVAYLAPGIDLTSEKFRCDGRQLVGALSWLTQELSRAKYNLFVLPLLTLQQYITTCVCRDVQRAAEARILRVRVLTDIRLFAEAMAILNQLLNGECLPLVADGSFRPREGQGTQSYTNSKSPADPQNLKTIETFMQRSLPASLGALYGPHLTCQLVLAQAHLLTSLASTIPVLPKLNGTLKQILQDRKPTMLTQSLKTSISVKSQQPVNAKETVLSPGLGSDSDVDMPPLACFSSAGRTVTLEEIKGLLLVSAEQTVNSMCDNILMKVSDKKQGSEDISADELELVVQCRLEQASVAQQKHRAPIAAHIMLTAMKLIQKARIFKLKKSQKFLRQRQSSVKTESGNTGKKCASMERSELDNSQFQNQKLQARSRLDARLWLCCRYELVRSLMMEVRGMGEIKREESNVVSDLADCRQYCAEGLEEAEMCGDTEMQAHFLFFGAQLNIIEGRNLDQTVSLLQDAIKHLHQVRQRSDSGEQLLITCIMFSADLEAAAKLDVDTEDAPIKKALIDYLDAQRIILKQMELNGEKIENYSSDGQEHLSSPVSPLQNVYLPYVERLAEVKLRIGHAKARNCAWIIRNGFSGDPVVLWAECLGVLSTALEISQASATRNATTEAEILLLMGKVQKMLVFLDKYQARAAANTLVKAIRISYVNDHYLGLMRQAYLEIALIYLYSCGLMTVKDGYRLNPGTDQDVSASNVDPATGQNTPVLTGERSEVNVTSDGKKKKSQLKSEKDKERQAAFMAIRCATATGNAQRCRSLLIGNDNVTSQKMAEDVVNGLPEFVSLDLLSRNVLGQKQKIYKNEIEEELAPLIEAQEVKVTESYEDQVSKVKAAAKNLSWIHILRYQSVLKRLINMATISASSQQLVKHKPNNESAELDADIMSQSCFSMSMNYDVVKYMLPSVFWSVRLSKMHAYLATNLKTYAADCCAPFPPPDLILPKLTKQSSDFKIPMKSYALNHMLNFELDLNMLSDVMIGSAKISLPPGSNLSTAKQLDKTSAKAELEVSVQWYQPGLGEDSVSQSGTSVTDKLIILLFAKAGKHSRALPSFRWVSLCKLYDLHSKLAVLAQNADILSSIQHDTSHLVSSFSKEGVKESQTVLSKLDQDEQIKVGFKQCLHDISALIGGASMKSEETTPEVNLTNIKNLERLFDPSVGMTLMGTDLLPWLLKLFS